MTVTSTQIGANTTQITLTGETSPGGLLTALDAAIVASGWTQYDVFNNGSQRIYRSLCKDGVAFKYLGIFFDIANFRIQTTGYESWNASTHVGLNECDTGNYSGVMHFTLTACDVIVMASPRWCILQTFIRNNPSPWSGIVECAREAVEDTAAAGYPPFGWICSLFAMHSGSGHRFISFPRNRAGATGVAAVADGYITPYARLGQQTGKSGDALTSIVTYVWDTSKRILHSLRPTFGATEVHGKLYGLKGTYNIGDPYTRVSVPIDADFQFSPTGTATEHWVLGNTPMTIPEVVTATGAPASSYASSRSTCTLPSYIRHSIFTGSAYYVGLSTGCTKIDGTLSALPATSTLLPGVPTADYYDTSYDGQYVYLAGPSGLVRIDTLNADAVTTLALPQGAGPLFWDGTWLWAAARTSIANNSLYKINPNTFSIAATITLSNAAGAAACGMCTDFNDGLYVVVGTSGKLFKVVISTGVVSVLVASITIPINNAAIYFNGANLEVLSYASSNTNQNQGFYSLTGTVLSPIGSSYLRSSGSTSPLAPYAPRVSYGRLGISSICASPVSSNASFSSSSASNGLSGNSSAGWGAACLGSPTFASGCSITCDGGRVYGGVNTTFFQTLGLCHSDDAAVVYNRFLLPK